jgi:hypothetical protein
VDHLRRHYRHGARRRRGVRCVAPPASNVLHRGLRHLRYQSLWHMACSGNTVSCCPITAVRLMEVGLYRNTPLSFDPGVRFFGTPGRLPCRLCEVAKKTDRLVPIRRDFRLLGEFLAARYTTLRASHRLTRSKHTGCVQHSKHKGWRTGDPTGSGLRRAG